MVYRRTLLLVGVLLLAVSGLMGPAGAADFPPHGHLLLHGVETVEVDRGPGAPPYSIVGFERCTELAAGRAVPLHAHHDRVHFGRAGQAVSRGGMQVVPTAPLFDGIESCADLEAALPYPPLPEP